MCNFKSLKRSNASDDESGSDSDKDNDDSPKKKRAKQTEKKPKNVEKGLGDMSSNSDDEQETDKDTDEEKPEAAKVRLQLCFNSFKNTEPIFTKTRTMKRVISWKYVREQAMAEQGHTRSLSS